VNPSGFTAGRRWITAARYMNFISFSNMIKNIFFFLTISFFVFLFAPTSYACDPFGCLLNGNKQDTLILGEVVSEAEDSLDIKIIFVFPQNQVESLKEGDQIKVGNLSEIINLTNAESATITTGKKYLMSLNQNDNFYVPAWGIYEIIGSSYSDAKLVENESVNDQALEIFINSGGTEKDFAFDDDVLIYNGVRQELEKKEKNILWYGIGVLILIGGLTMVVRTKK